MARPALREDGIPTRDDLTLMTPAERAIFDAMQAVEEAGTSERLTDALTWLKWARERVADHVEGKPSAGAEEARLREEAMERRRQRLRLIGGPEGPAQAPLSVSLTIEAKATDRRTLCEALRARLLAILESDDADWFRMHGLGADSAAPVSGTLSGNVGAGRRYKISYTATED